MNLKKMALLTDFYELTMMQGFFKQSIGFKQCIFDFFYRSNPNGFGIFAGLEQLIIYLENLRFTKDDIEYLATHNMFSQDFLDYLESFKFTGDIYAVPEGSVVFPGEPLVKVKANLMEAHIIEGALLNILNFQSLIATKAARITNAAKNDKVLEFGLRRAQGPDAALYGSRAAIIGGCAATSNVAAGKAFGVPVTGTHAHSWIMSFPGEIEAFRAYANLYPNNMILLIDTYNSLKSGLENALKVFDEFKPIGIYGVRLDSGDLAYLSKEARKRLDEAGYKDALIIASNDLDEELISQLKLQKACINAWGVGTNLITGGAWSAFGGVYKLAAIEEDGKLMPKIKISESPEKINNPCDKKIIRLYDKYTKKIKADLICLNHETIDTSQDLTLFHPIQTWKKMKLKSGNFLAKELLLEIFKKGKPVYQSPAVLEIQNYANQEKESLWEEYKRLTFPQNFPVDLSLELYELKEKMIKCTYDKVHE